MDVGRGREDRDVHPRSRDARCAGRADAGGARASDGCRGDGGAAATGDGPRRRADAADRRTPKAARDAPTPPPRLFDIPSPPGARAAAGQAPPRPARRSRHQRAPDPTAGLQAGHRTGPSAISTARSRRRESRVPGAAGGRALDDGTAPPAHAAAGRQAPVRRRRPRARRDGATPRRRAGLPERGSRPRPTPSR